MNEDTLIDYERLSSELILKAAKTTGGKRDNRREAFEAAFKKAYSSLSYKEVSSVTNVYGHGPGGLFSMAGLSKPLFSAMLLPLVGLLSRIPAKPSQDANPIFGLLTGVTATSGSEPTGECDDPPTAGMAKLCMHTFVFSNFMRQTRAFNIARAGVVTNRGEFLDLQLVNSPFEVEPRAVNGPTLPVNTRDVVRSESAKALFELGVSMIRDSAREVYTGNPTNNTAGGGRKYYYGLDILINTGYRDAESGTACAAADSIVQSFGNNRVDLAPTSAVTVITYIYRNLKYIAERVGLAPVKWVLTMRFGLFYELTQVWPIAYYTNRNTVTTADQQLFNNGKELIDLRDKMRNDKYLLIDGEEVEVVIDEAITETEPAAGVFSSTLYFVPLTVLGGTPVTYFEHINYDAPYGAMEFASLFAPGNSYQTSDGGRFLWHKKPPANFCVQMVAKTENRLLLLTPHIAARLTNIRYSPYLHERGSFTDDGYWVNGGRTDRLGYPPSLFSPTS